MQLLVTHHRYRRLEFRYLLEKIFLLAARVGNVEVLDRMIDAGINIHSAGMSSNPHMVALTLAAKHERTNIIKRFLERGLYRRHPNFNTALVATIYHRREDTARLLIEESADANAHLFDPFGQGFCGAALAAAARRENLSMMRLLRSKGATPRPCVCP